METLEKLKKILREAFPPPATLELDDDDGIIGVLISTRFEDMESIDRQNMIWDILDKALTKKEKRQILTIVATTPKEYAFHTAKE
ncbi:MAG: hypothetical protein ABSG67_01025 [Thermoguttaceae bacterium]|jgi:stress-induced morphogen